MKYILIIATSLLIFSCGGENNPASEAQEEAYDHKEDKAMAESNAEVEENTVIIKNREYVPSVLTVSKGTTVSWLNEDDKPHTVTSTWGYKRREERPEGEESNRFPQLNSGNITKGYTYEYTFDSLGVFNYHCDIHPGMEGKIVVE